MCDFGSTVLHVSLYYVEVCQKSAVRLPRGAFDHICTILWTPKRFTILWVSQFFFLQKRQELLSSKANCSTLVLIIKLYYNILHLISPFQDVASTVLEFSVKVDKLLDAVLTNMFCQRLRLLPSQRASFRQQTHSDYLSVAKIYT